jgi:hypothetical protein
MNLLGCVQKRVQAEPTRQEHLVRANRPTQAEPTLRLRPSRTLPTEPFHFPAPLSPRTAQPLLFPGDVARAVAIVCSPALVFVPPARARPPPPSPRTAPPRTVPPTTSSLLRRLSPRRSRCARARDRRASASAPSPVSLSPFLDLFCDLR